MDFYANNSKALRTQEQSNLFF